MKSSNERKMSIQRQTMCYNNTLNPNLCLKLAQIWSVNVTFTLYSLRTNQAGRKAHNGMIHGTLLLLAISMLFILMRDSAILKPLQFPYFVEIPY